MIQQIDNGFVIASRGTWLPGVYADRKAAQWAFQFHDDDLDRLNGRVCILEQREITTDDLRSLR